MEDTATDPREALKQLAAGILDDFVQRHEADSGVKVNELYKEKLLVAAGTAILRVSTANRRKRIGGKVVEESDSEYKERIDAAIREALHSLDSTIATFTKALESADKGQRRRWIVPGSKRDIEKAKPFSRLDKSELKFVDLLRSDRTRFGTERSHHEIEDDHRLSEFLVACKRVIRDIVDRNILIGRASRKSLNQIALEETALGRPITASAISVRYKQLKTDAAKLLNINIDSPAHVARGATTAGRAASSRRGLHHTPRRNSDVTCRNV